MNSRFTLDGSDELERLLDDLCRQITKRVCALVPDERMEALVLGGGYGRGEGGVLQTPAGDAPYNDLEFYAFIRGNTLLNERRYGPALHKLGHDFTERAGIEVEFKVLSIRKLERSPVTMFYYDLVSAHRLLHGAEGVLNPCERHRAGHRIPLYEATRLLMNRCSGLLFSKELLERPSFGPEEADFTARNIAKAKLALGDVILTAYGQYHFSCRERHRRLEKLAHMEETSWANSFLQSHREGMEFKLRPFKSTSSRDALAREHRAVSELALKIWLWLENLRLGQRFDSPEAYALSGLNKAPESDPLKNALLTARTLGAGAALSSGGSRYPRERLLNTLPLLLWCERPFERPELRQRIAQQLRVAPADLPAAVSAYKRIWNRFN